MAINITRTVTAPEVKIDPPKPPPPPPPPEVKKAESAFEAAPTKTPVRLDRNDCDVQGRRKGTNDDSIGRKKGTNDDSIGRNRGTNDDSIGRNRGTNDDSIGRGRGTNDDSIGRASDGRLSRELKELGAPHAVQAVYVNGLGLDGPSRLKVTALLSNPATAGDASFALNSKTFRDLDSDQRAKFVDVMAATGANGARLLAVSCENGSDISAPRGTDGTTALDNLQRMTKAGMADGALEVMADIVVPDRVWQGEAPTCTASTMQYEMAKNNAGEYARIMAGLALEGHVDMAGGGRLQVDLKRALDASRNADDGRSATEAVFQAAVMDFANGRDAYDVDKMESTRQLGRGMTKTYQGLYGDQIRDMLGQLFGAHYETTRINTNEDAARILPRLPISEGANRPVLIDLVIDEKHNHCVAFEGVKGDTVMLRDPQNGKRFTITRQEFLDSAASVHIAPGSESDFDWSRPQMGNLFTTDRGGD